jgi:hemerythrin-like metal-binding protein
MKHDVFIVWKNEYNLGIPIIDEHHRGIVSTINSLHFGMVNNYVEEMLNPIINMMYDYTRIHFNIEEAFLEQIDFPTAKAHHELHLELTSKLNVEGRRSSWGKDPYEFLDFLKKWWIDHICGEDLLFRNYLLTIGN